MEVWKYGNVGVGEGGDANQGGAPSHLFSKSFRMRGTNSHVVFAIIHAYATAISKAKGEIE